MNKKSLIQNISKTRKKKNITQKELSQRTGISQQVISKVEQEDSNPKLDTLIAIANAMNCDIIFVDKNDNNIIRLETDRYWLDARKELEDKKRRLKKEIERLQSFNAIHPNIKKYQPMLQNKINALNSLKQNSLKQITVAQLFKNIQDSEYGDVEEIEHNIHEVQDWINDLEDKIPISYDLFECIEACKDLCSMFDSNKNIVELDVINRIREEVDCCKEIVDDIAYDLCHLSDNTEEIQAEIKNAMD